MYYDIEGSSSGISVTWVNEILTSNSAGTPSKVESVSALLSIVCVDSSSFHSIYILIFLVLLVSERGIVSVIGDFYVSKFIFSPSSMQ